MTTSQTSDDEQAFLAAQSAWRQALRTRFGTDDLRRIYSHEKRGESGDHVRAAFDRYVAARDELHRSHPEFCITCGIKADLVQGLCLECADFAGA